jgi:multidrug efflux pump
VVSLYLDRFRLSAKRHWHRAFPGLETPEAAE